MIPTVGPYLLPRVVPVLRKTYPRLMLIWVEDKTDALVRAINHGDLDAALLALEADLDDLDHHTIAVDPFVLAVPPEHELGRGAKPVTRNRLRGERVLLLDDGHCFRDQVLEYCSSNRLEELGFRATSLSTLTQMVSGGAGLTLLPTIAVPTETQRSQLSIRDACASRPFPNDCAWMAPPVSAGRYTAHGGRNPSCNGGNGSGHPPGPTRPTCEGAET